MPIFFAFTVCAFFLASGAAVFVICGLIPPLRKFGLSAALWCAVWGPCSVAYLFLVSIAGFAAVTGVDRLGAGKVHVPVWHDGYAWALVGLGALLIATVASALAWLHQILVRRMTFVLFRLYAALVSAGVGSVWGWALGFSLLSQRVAHSLPVWVVMMTALVAGFGMAAWYGAREMRGTVPEKFAFVTREEFEGTTF